MTLYENRNEFAGKPVKDFKMGEPFDFAANAPRLRCDWDSSHTLRDLLASMFETPSVEKLDVLVFGVWMENGEAFEVSPRPALEMLVSMKEVVPNIRAIFVGDIASEENEMSWIEQCDHSAVFGAFPKLTEYGAKGGNALRLGQINHAALKTLRIETGGMPAPLVREAISANAPLTHLELWLGEENYGASFSIEDLSPLLLGERYPELEYLGLRNSMIADNIAEALASSPVLDRLKVLDLSLGTLTDRGAKALLAGGKLGGLEKINISHHYVSDPILQELKRAVKELVAEDKQAADNYGDEVYYYIAIGE